MRILLTEAVDADSLAIEAEARRRGHEVVRCQPRGASAMPCIGVADPGTSCPFDRHIDVVVDVRPNPEADGAVGVQLRELGMVCALRERVPIVVVGANPLGAAGTPAAESEALDTATRLARRTSGRPDIGYVEQQVARALVRTGSRARPVWVGYLDRGADFDVVVETDRIVGRAAREETERTLHALLWQAREESRLGVIVFEQR